MVVYERIGTLPATWTQAQGDALAAATAWGHGQWMGTMNDGVYGASRGPSSVLTGTVVNGGGDTPSWRVTAEVGGGSVKGHDWWVWKMIDWGVPDVVLTAPERETLEGRLAYIWREIRIWEELHLANPGAAMRDISALRLERSGILAKLEPPGDLYVVRYIGYAKRVSGSRFLLPFVI